MKLVKSLVVVALLLLPLTTLHAQLLDKKVLTLEAADTIAAAAGYRTITLHDTPRDARDWWCGGD